MDKQLLLTQLQSLRLKLHEIAEARGSLTDPAVIAISEEADQLIVALQYLQRDEIQHTSNLTDIKK
ncbi:Spo0E family sporulation regulatory protein-aspartic acid phosphatase [Paenibacillus sp. strain BS8-2]